MKSFSEAHRIEVMIKGRSTEELIRTLEQSKLPEDVLNLVKKELQSRPDFLPVGDNK